MAAVEPTKQSTLQSLRNWGGPFTTLSAHMRSHVLALHPMFFYTCYTCSTTHTYPCDSLVSLIHAHTINRKLRPSNSPRNSHHSPACSTIPTTTHAVPSHPTLLILFEPEQLQDRLCWCHCGLEWSVRFTRNKTITGKSLFILLPISTLNSMLDCFCMGGVLTYRPGYQEQIHRSWRRTRRISCPLCSQHCRLWASLHIWKEGERREECLIT
jgi:hypothetical protein